MKHLITLLFAVTLIVQSQNMVKGELLVDFVLQGEQYTGVAYDDMFDMLNDACESEANN